MWPSGLPIAALLRTRKKNRAVIARKMFFYISVKVPSKIMEVVGFRSLEEFKIVVEELQ